MVHSLCLIFRPSVWSLRDSSYVEAFSRSTEPASADGQACTWRQGGEQSPRRGTADAPSAVCGSHDPCAAQVYSRPSDNRIRASGLQYEDAWNVARDVGLHVYQVTMPPQLQAPAFRPGSLTISSSF